MTVSQQLDTFIAENGGNERDALNVALARLELAESKLSIESQINMPFELQIRAEVLIGATIEILSKCERSGYVVDVMQQTAIWDGVECDGSCLKEELEQLLLEIKTANQSTPQP